jgi:hypothetical protein
MDPDRLDPPQPVAPSCPLCGTAYPWDAARCLTCGEPRIVPIDRGPPPARTGDIVSAFVVALLAGVATMPLNVLMTDEVWRTGDLAFGVIVGVWNLLIWGAPVALVGWYWYRGAKRGDPDKSYLWRIYWRAQIATFGGITALAILLLTICAASM